MELLPVLDPEEKPREGLWYALIPRGGGPGVSVGHTCTYVPCEDGGKGKVLIVGGANPNGSFSESHVINLDSHEWDIPDWEGLEARYEHCSFVPESYPQSVWVFAGAQQNGNFNCVQNLQFPDGGTWKSVEVKGMPPCPRTYHTNSASVGNRLFVFSGGDSGATPVSDARIHVFDTVSCTWSQPDTQGIPPPARHGHVVVAVGSKLYVHGGMAGEKLHSDMYSLDTDCMKWEKVQAKGDIPPGVAAHSAVALVKDIYIFGGLTSEGASNAMYRFQCDKKRWTLLRFEGDLPPNRLDHSMCVLPWRVSPEGSEEGNKNQNSSGPVLLALVFGGMDTHGVIHSDCVVTVLT
ncbi:rab9 effector protein with kelch motifs [Esox lucius]|uniref:Rab9 effector protein with kelch motifs n=1 Tax=Esox lucius TaxID=8010 RepID=A0A3P8YEL0_ESOLU|nr:rab9 effector protein with kelch motifs [Esox lucius]XP_019908976.1 rab9 effector protein with kelch motifs [Esox lucius]